MFPGRTDVPGRIVFFLTNNNAVLAEITRFFSVNGKVSYVSFLFVLFLCVFLALKVHATMS